MMEILQARDSDLNPGMTLADVAEALDLRLDEAAELLHQANLENSQWSGPIRSAAEKSLAFRIALIFIGAVCISGAALFSISVLARSREHVEESGVAFEGQAPAATKVRVPEITPNEIDVPPGFFLRINGTYYASEIRTFKNDNGLRPRLERDLSTLIQDSLHKDDSLQGRTIPLTITIGTDRGKADLDLTTEASAFPVTSHNPASQRLIADIHEALDVNWTKLIGSK